MTNHTTQELIELGRDREAVAAATRGRPRAGAEQLDAIIPMLEAIVAHITDDQLNRSTACANFTVAGVLEHMIGGATAFAAGFRGEPAPPADAGGPADPVGGVGRALTDLIDAMHSPGALDRTIAAPFGDVPGEAFARFVVLDGLVHGWDIATAIGLPYEPPDALVAAVDGFAREAILPTMREAEMFAAPADAPAIATPIEQLVAFTGRSVVRSQR
jgi:uncharacterized protein (TIGR03086 family)